MDVTVVVVSYLNWSGKALLKMITYTHNSSTSNFLSLTVITNRNKNSEYKLHKDKNCVYLIHYHILSNRA